MTMTTAQPCPACDGAGQVDESHPLSPIAHNFGCEACGGTGVAHETCPTCGGSGANIYRRTCWRCQGEGRIPTDKLVVWGWFQLAHPYDKANRQQIGVQFPDPTPAQEAGIIETFSKFENVKIIRRLDGIFIRYVFDADLKYTDQQIAAAYTLMAERSNGNFGGRYGSQSYHRQLQDRQNSGSPRDRRHEGD